MSDMTGSCYEASLFGHYINAAENYLYDRDTG
jgi:hypothetical protein